MPTQSQRMFIIPCPICKDSIPWDLQHDKLAFAEAVRNRVMLEGYCSALHKAQGMLRPDDKYVEGGPCGPMPEAERKFLDRQMKQLEQSLATARRQTQVEHFLARMDDEVNTERIRVIKKRQANASKFRSKKSPWATRWTKNMAMGFNHNLIMGPCPACGCRIPEHIIPGHPEWNTYAIGRMECHGFCSKWHMNNRVETDHTASLERTMNMAAIKGIQDVWMGIFQLDYHVDGYWIEEQDGPGYWQQHPPVSDELREALDDPEAEYYGE